MKILTIGLLVGMMVFGLGMGGAHAAHSAAEVVCAHSAERGFSNLDEDLALLTSRLNSKLKPLVGQGYEISAPSQTVTSASTILVCVTATKPRP